jgi:polar amino acid transport system substrate-binding protein
VGARFRAILGVAVLVGLIGGLPGLAGAAPAPPRVVSISTYDIEPFVMTEDGVKSGFTIDLLNAIAKRTGWTYNYTEGKTVKGILADVTAGRADAAAAAISITSDRAEVVDFSQPILNAGLQIVVPTGAIERSQPGLSDFLKLLFSKTMAVWLLAAFALTVIPAHIIWLLERRHADSMVSKSYFPGIFQAFAWGLGMLAAAPDDAPRHWQTRALGVLWAFVSIIFVAYYTATLTANLTVEKFDSQIGSPTDLVGRSVCTIADTTGSDYLTELGVGFTGAPRLEDCYAGLKKGEYEAVVTDAPLLQYYVAHGGAGVAEIASPIFQFEDYGIAFPLGSDLRKQIDDALLSIRENGDYELIKRKWLGAGEP